MFLAQPRSGSTGPIFAHLHNGASGAKIAQMRTGSCGPISAHFHSGASGMIIAQLHTGSSGPIFARTGGMRLRSHAPVGIVGRGKQERLADRQPAGCIWLPHTKTPRHVGQGGEMRRDVCERSTGPLGPSCGTRKGFVHVW